MLKRKKFSRGYIVTDPQTGEEVKIFAHRTPSGRASFWSIDPNADIRLRADNIYATLTEAIAGLEEAFADRAGSDEDTNGSISPWRADWEWHKTKRAAWAELHDRLYGDDEAVS